MDFAIEKRVGENIRSIRIKAGLTQEMLSAKLQLEGCDVTRSALAKIEVGQRHLYPDEIIFMQKILNVTFEEILKIDQKSRTVFMLYGLNITLNLKSCYPKVESKYQR